ncbi:MAG: Polyphosphate kinase [Verrucomicrobia bacterium ADurb.Bin474]|nr:MAG: Polyphosphate kinase [Verrucomicrobia bacterium ADurb.Bin474]
MQPKAEQRVDFGSGIRSVTRAEIRKPTRKIPFFNRELSWLSFNRRVLEQSMNPAVPLLERVRYLGFVASNLDEFFEIRVAGLIQQDASGITDPSPDGLEPKEQLKRIREVTSQLVADQYLCWHNTLIPDLAKERIFLKLFNELGERESHWAESYFESEIYPVITPLAIDPCHPFPSLLNKSLNIFVELENPDDPAHPLNAIIPVPRILPRVLRIPETDGEGTTLVLISSLVKRYAGRLFPGLKVAATHAFRITRNSDLYVDEEESQNLLKTIEKELHKIKRGDAVRLEIEKSVSEDNLRKLMEANHLDSENLYLIDGPINMMRITSICDIIQRPDLKFAPFVPYTPPALTPPNDFFAAIRKEDKLLHHPFESFEPFVDFLNRASVDPKVFAIKQTLYRTSGDSPIVDALIKASMNGKQVAALIEIMARFDEENNIQWAKRLEETGVHVVYGLVGLKTHCKCCLVVRREDDGMKRYAHIGTGNYNPKTARLYTDLSYFTANDAITADVALLFNTLTGFSRAPKFEHLLVAPFNLHSTLCSYIRKETENALAGRPARIIVKANSLIDRETIDLLYAASHAGVQIDLIIRGICGIVPGLKTLSQNIRVRSILGRFLEHHRIFYFENAGDQPRILVGSSDWMPRNFYRRIEAVVPIYHEPIRQRIMDILNTYLGDNVNARLLRSNGAYAPVTGKDKAPDLSAQEFFMQEATERRKLNESKKSPTPVIKTHPGGNSARK